MHNAVIMLKTLSKLASGLQLHCPKGLGKLLLLRRQGGNSILELLSQLKLSMHVPNRGHSMACSRRREEEKTQSRETLDAIIEPALGVGMTDISRGMVSSSCAG